MRVESERRDRVEREIRNERIECTVVATRA